MKKVFYILIVLTLSGHLSGQTKNIIIDDNKLDQLKFGMTIKSAEKMLGKDYIKKIKTGHHCNYYKGYSNVTTQLFYQKQGVTLQFEKRYQSFGFLKKEKLCFISIADSSTISVNGLSLRSDTSQITKIFGMNYDFDQSDADTYLMIYGEDGIWFFLDPYHKAKEIVIESKIITQKRATKQK